MSPHLKGVAAVTGEVTDPQAIRHFSILPDEDADEAYCVRHARDMWGIDPVIHLQGALYTTAGRFSVYTCPSCLEEINSGIVSDFPDSGVKAYQLALMQAFSQWDRGDAPGDWFRYVGEGTLEDLDDDGALVALGSHGDEGNGGEGQ